jgi:hypothetical protein
LSIRISVGELSIELLFDSTLEKVTVDLVGDFITDDPPIGRLFLSYEPLTSRAFERRAGYRPHLPLSSLTSLQLVGRREVHAILRVPHPDAISAAIGFYLSLVLPGHSGLLFHGSTLVVGNMAHVFLAKSGGGKSTICKNSSVGSVLHDDKVIVRKIGGKWFVFGVPMLGNDGKPAVSRRLLLRAQYLLEKALEERLVCVHKAQAVTCLPQHVILPVCDRDIQDRTIETLFDLACCVDIYKLRFMRHSDVACLLVD